MSKKEKIGKKFDEKLLKTVLPAAFFIFAFSFAFSFIFASPAFAASNFTAEIWTMSNITDFTKINRTTFTALTSQNFTLRINNSATSTDNIIQVNISNATGTGSNGLGGYVVTEASGPGWACSVSVSFINCTAGAGYLVTPNNNSLINLSVSTPIAGAGNESMWALAVTDNASTPITNYGSVYTVAADQGDIAYDIKDELANILYNSSVTLLNPTGGLTINTGRATVKDDATNNQGWNDTFINGLILFRKGSGANAAIQSSANGNYDFNITGIGYVNVSSTGNSHAQNGFNSNRNAQNYAFKIRTVNDELNITVPQNATDSLNVFTSGGALATPVNKTFASNGNWYVAIGAGNYIFEYMTRGYVKTNTTATLSSVTSAQTNIDYFTGGSGSGPGLPYSVRVIAFDEIGRMVNLNGSVPQSTNFAAWVNVTPAANFLYLRYNATANTTYIAANGTLMINVSQPGFANATNNSVIAISNSTQTLVQFGNGTFGNGTVGTCAGGNSNCQPNVTFTVKVVIKDEFENPIYGATVWLNATEVPIGYMYAIDGRVNDSDNQTNGVIYWALPNTGSTRWRVNVTNITGFLEWNSTNNQFSGAVNFTINNNSQSSTTSYNNFTLLVNTSDENERIIYSTNALGNISDVSNGTTSCFKNSTRTNMWGCPIQPGTTVAVNISVNASIQSGYVNTSLTYTAIPANFWSNQFTNKTYNNFTVRIVTNDEFNQNIYGTGTTNVTDVGNISVSCVQNVTNTFNWMCLLQTGNSPTRIFVNVSATSGYLNYSFTHTPPTNNNAQNQNTSYGQFTVLMTAQDEFSFPIYETGTTNITNVTTNPATSIACNRNATNTYNWGCRISGGGMPTISVNVTNSSGFLNATNASVFTAPTTAGPQSAVFSNNKYTVLLTARDEFNNLIYSPAGAATNITNVVFNYTASLVTGSGNVGGIVNCAKNATNTSVWGCPAPVYGAAQERGNATSFNVSATSGYLNFTSQGFNVPVHTDPAAQITNTSVNLYSIRIATANEFNNLIYNFSGGVANVSVVYGNVTGGTPVFCNLNSTNQSVWGCRFMPGILTTTAFVNTSSGSGYLNYSFTVAPATGTNASSQTYNTSFSQFRVRIRSVDEFANVIYNATSPSPFIGVQNVTDVYISSPSINCVQNVTNGDFWGCPLNVSDQIIRVNVSTTSGYLNSTNKTTYTTPLTTDTQADLNSSNSYSVVVYTTNSFGSLLTGTNNVSLVQYNTGANFVDCVRNVTNSSNWGCRGNVTTGQVPFSVNMSTASGYINFSSFIMSGYAGNVTGAVSNTQNTSITRMQHSVNVSTADELGNLLNAFVVVVNGTAGASVETYLTCEKNATNTSVWGCAIPNSTTRIAVVNVTHFGFVNSSTTGVAINHTGGQPTAVTSSQQFTLRVGLLDGTVDPASKLNATVAVLRDANTRTLFSYTTYNDTNGFYYFPVNASNETAINATVTKIGYQSQAVKDNRAISTESQRRFNLTLTQVNASDTTAPTITVTAPVNTTNVSSSTPSVTFTVTDGSEVDLTSISVSGVSGFSSAQNCTGNILQYSCSFKPTLTDGTNYTVTFNARDASGNSATQQTLQIGYSSNTIVTLKLINSTRNGIADNTFANGWTYTFNVTLGTSGNATRFRMDDWCLVGSDCVGNNKITISGNAIMNYTTQNGTTILYNVRNNYNETELIYPLFDIEGTSGTQGNVTIYVKIPTSTNAGSYSTTFAAGLYSVPVTGG